MKKLLGFLLSAVLIAGSFSSFGTTINGANYGGAALTPGNGDTLSGTFTNVGTFWIQSGYTVYIKPGVPLSITANIITIEGTLNGNKAGYAGGAVVTNGVNGNVGAGPGGGGAGGYGPCVHGTGGGGGAHGGNGGNSSQSFISSPVYATGGTAYGNATALSSIFMGSGGGSGAGYCPSPFGGYFYSGGGGAGGGAVELIASSLTISGTITVNGENGTDGSWGAAGGGGAGGGINITATDGSITGTLSANGGKGGDASTVGFAQAGGGGAGGRIKLSSDICITGASLSVTAGGKGNNAVGLGTDATAGGSGTTNGGTNSCAKALHFDGSDDQLVVSSVSRLNVNNSYTFEAWVKPSGSSYRTILSKGNGNGTGPNGEEYIFQIDNINRVALYLSNGNGWRYSSSSISNSTWSHVAVTMDGSQVKFYINGVLDNTASVSSLPANNDAGSFYIGRQGATCNCNFFSGTLDDIRVWNTVRTCAEIKSTLNHQLAGNETGLVAYYPLNQGVPNANNSGVTTAFDLQTNFTAANGAVTNFTLNGTTSNWVSPGSGVSGTTPDGQPEINIKGNAVSIVDGDNTPSLSDSTDFGTIYGAVTRSFTIENTGTALLNISSINVTGTNASDFVVSGAPVSVAAGGSAVFYVTFTPGGMGLRTATITVNSADCDESAYDYTVQGGRQAEALNFVGGNDYVSVAGGAGLNNLQSGTIELWVKWSGSQDAGYSGSAYGAVTGRQSNGVFSNQVIGLDGSNPATAKVIWKPYGWTTNAAVSSVSPGDGVWNHIAVTYSSGNHKLYLNGNLVGTGTNAGSVNNNAAIPFTIGAWIGDGDAYSTSTIDEVRIWNYERTCGEINSTMNHELVGNESGLLSYYNFNTGIAGGNNTSLTTLTDNSGNGNTGTLTNMALTGTTSNWVAPGSGVIGTTPDLQPEINVKGNSVTIVDGDNTPSTTDHTNWGNASIGANTPRTFTIENTGTGPLNVTSITTSGTDASMFIVGLMTPASPIPAGGSATVTVNFNPSSVGTKTATLNIQNSDCDETPYNFALEGTGQSPAAALHLDGSNDYVTFGNPSNVNFTKTTPFTIETWIKAEPGVSSDQQIISKLDGAFKGYGIQLCNDANPARNGKIEFYLIGTYSGNNALWIRSAYPGDLRDNYWHHIAVTYDGSNTLNDIHIYVDGADFGHTVLGTTSISADISNSAPLQIGAYYGSGTPSEFFKGTVDEMRIWNRSLCRAEIQASITCEMNANRDKLLGAYHFNQGYTSAPNTSETTLFDATTNAMNGTLNNFALTGSTSNWVAPGAVTTGNNCAPRCNSNSPVATAPGTYTSNMTQTDPSSGFTNFCDCTGKLLLSLKLGGTGAVVPDNGVSLRITSTGSTFYPHGVGFVGNLWGYAAMDRTWDVAPTTQPSSPVPVRFYFSNSDVTSLNGTLVANGLQGVTLPEELSFWKVTNPSKPAHAPVATLAQSDVKVQMNGSVTNDTTWVLGNRSVGDYYAQFNVNSFSGGGGGAGPLGLTPLPVELLNLSANGIDNKFIRVSWTTAQEQNSAYFDVERSENGKDFVKVGTTAAAGFSESPLNYSLNDATAESNKIYYYRLKMVDFNGSFSYSHLVMARLSSVQPTHVAFFPNPASTSISVLWPEGTETAKLRISTLEGKTVYSNDFGAFPASRIDVNHLLNGIYMVSFEINGTVLSSKLVIQK